MSSAKRNGSLKLERTCPKRAELEEVQMHDYDDDDDDDDEGSLTCMTCYDDPI